GILLPLIAKADAILLAGYDPIEMRVGWRHPWTAETPVIDITPVRVEECLRAATAEWRFPAKRTVTNVTIPIELTLP
ncbi:MAG: hypothetical protein AAF447_20755, partial [Myxococcota bacterium]